MSTKLNLRHIILCGAFSMMSLGLLGCNNDEQNDSSTTTSNNEVKSLKLIGDYSIPTKTMYNGVEFGGISGLDRDEQGRYWAISDDRGGERGAPRFYQLAIELDQTKIKQVQIKNMIYLRDQKNQFLPSDQRSMDPESIRVAANGHLYISSEGNFVPDHLIQPFVREYKLNGEYVADFNLPVGFHYVDNKTTGGRSNKLFESLTLTPKGQLFTANEDSLIQDGEVSNLEQGGIVRIMKLDPKNYQSQAQYAYKLEKIPHPSKVGGYPADNGLSELFAISENEFIAVERAFADGIGNTIRLYKTQIAQDTTDIQKVEGLKNAKYTAMKKQLLLEMPLNYHNIKLDNIEAISWGPTLNNGHRSLILVADNNFSEQQTTQFIAFEVIPN
ncbi:esterase-like activity of phytase family protein [Acinetobacter rudis]|uniref:Esterase-like activity of phytase family protein n=1 Tax=Acinetobacter rudis TaxID=632955 RepID=A0AAW8J7R7_9GAMM|nr:esterase-like activity of phytase family protein [Acinetobacter rudis]MDQ8935482.1 esterase-like activity of phytase family protein [Acinetobacter rudis]MDQ9017751.1 esterase-like activity of phytase family protein [Acinetobacter rudis]